jgi:ribonuclease HI
MENPGMKMPQIQIFDATKMPTNNEAKEMVVYQGLCMLKERNIANVTVVGDSPIIIRA